MFTDSPQSRDTDLYPLLSPMDPAGPPQQYCPNMDYFASTENSQFFVGPNFSFDPNMVDFTDMLPFPQEPMQAGAGQQVKLKSRIRASRACIACRSRHMKCDSVEPVCTRCQIYNKTCVYTKSRRGGSHKVPQADDLKSSPQARTQQLHASDGQASSRDENRSPNALWESTSNLRLSIISDVSSLVSLDDCPGNRVKDVDLITSYYEFFHNAHPVVLPKRQLMSRMQTNPTSLKHLLPVVRYIGSVYLPDVPSSPYQRLAEEAVDSPSLPINGFSVQALTLYSLARHCSDEYEVAESYVDKAIDIGLAIGMHQQEWANTNGEGDPVLTESWRRTWWLVFTCDTLFSAISHYSTHRLQSVATTVDLPCEDSEYESGLIPEPHTFAEYDHREFADEEMTFSSMTYLLDVMRIISSLSPVIYSPHEPGDSVLTSSDAKFVNWFLYLPKCKQDKVRKDGKVDETMFFACLVINTGKLLLHRPHSYLPYSPLEHRSKCTPLRIYLDSRLLQQSLAMHTAKAIEALSCTINLFALPGDNIKHTPIATCALALAIMAQVSACGFHGRGGWCTVQGEEGDRQGGLKRAEIEYLEGRERVRLGLGALRAGVRVWGFVKRSVAEVVGVARDLITGQTTPGRCESAEDKVNEVRDEDDMNGVDVQ